MGVNTVYSLIGAGFQWERAKDVLKWSSLHLSRLVRKPTMLFQNRSDTNRAVQSQKQARSLKFRIQVEEEMYYPCSKNKGADQLRGYREADLRLCFRICRLLVFS